MTPILHSGPGLVIGIPTLGRPVPLDWALALKSMNPPTNYSCIFQIVKGQDVASARNEIARFAIEKKAKYLFFLGDDTVPPAHTLRQLIFRMEHDESIGVVGGVYCCKSDPAEPLVYRGNGQGCYWDWKIGEFFEVTGLGLDCNLIRVSLLEKLPPPWFKTVSEDKFIDAVNDAQEWTEDLYFYKRVAEETKFRIFCEASVIAEHHDVYGGRVYKLPVDSLPMRSLVTKKEKRLLQIGRSPIEISDKDREVFEIVRFGAEDFVDYRGHSEFLPFADAEFDWVLGSIDFVFTDTLVKEWIRVAKSKVTIQFPRFANLQSICDHLKSQEIPAAVSGNFVEVNLGG